MSDGELERLTRRYISEIQIIIGPEKDIPAPDVNTNPKIMAWVMDTFSMNVGYSVPGVVTGKPLILGGSKGRLDATARGVEYIIEEAAKVFNFDLPTSKIVIQGFGNVGSNLALQLYKKKRKVIAVSDIRGGAYNPNGLDIPQLIKHKEKTGSVINFRGGKNITNKQLLEMECDILVPAAVEAQITIKNAERIKARMIVEAANGPTTPEADKILLKNKKIIIPDILANAGGVTVSYFEWIQSLQAYFWQEEEVYNKLKQVMITAFYEVLELSRKSKVDLRTAALMLAVSRVAEATRLRGIWP
jgi:glutamate dehydrogenase (NAD(P)+)